MPYLFLWYVLFVCKNIQKPSRFIREKEMIICKVRMTLSTQGVRYVFLKDNGLSTNDLKYMGIWCILTQRSDITKTLIKI